MKKYYLIITTAYLLFNLFVTSSYISPQEHTPGIKSPTNKSLCGPFEFKFYNPAGYAVTRITFVGPSTSWVFNNPTFPFTVPGAPFEAGNYSVRVALSNSEVSGSIRIYDVFSGLRQCETFFNNLIPPVHFSADCTWYEIEISNVDTCP